MKVKTMQLETLKKDIKNHLFDTIRANNLVQGLRNNIYHSFVSNTVPPYRFLAKNFFCTLSLEKMEELVNKLPGEELIHLQDEGMTYRLFDLDDVLYFVEANPIREVIEEIRLFMVGTTNIPESLLDIFKSFGCSENRKPFDKAEVSFASIQHGQVSHTFKNFTPITFDSIAKNYVPEVQEQVSALIERLKTEVTGIVILEGPPGTGKTYLIRAILSELNNYRQGLVCSPPLEFIRNLALIQEAMEDFNYPLVIFEDLGEIFSETAKVEYSDQFSNLANLSDGLMGMIQSGVYLVTFNYDVNKIDKALTRPGRCIATIHVPELSIEQAKTLLPEDTELPKTNSRTISLARVYETKSEEKSLVKPIKPDSRLGYNLGPSAYKPY